MELFRAATYVKLGDGRRAKFWSDKWLPGGRSVQDLLPALFSYAHDSGISVAKALANRRWVRDISGGLSLQAIGQYLHLWDVVQETTLTEGQVDRLIWRCSAGGAFTVKSAYNLFFMANATFACAKPI
jgi:hypothetical protein